MREERTDSWPHHLRRPVWKEAGWKDVCDLFRAEPWMFETNCLKVAVGVRRLCQLLQCKVDSGGKGDGETPACCWVVLIRGHPASDGSPLLNSENAANCRIVTGDALKNVIKRVGEGARPFVDVND